MDDVIKIENIKVNQEAIDWKDAIRHAGSLLLTSGTIRKQYIEDMIQSVVDLGPYIVIMPYFALAHAAPSEHVLQSDISILTLKKGVNFNSDNDPVKIVMCLACTDRSSHLEKLQIIAEKMLDENIVDAMLACNDEKELYLLLNS